MKQVMVDLSKCLGCKSCEIACAVAHSESGNLFGAMLEVKKPLPRVYVEAGDGISFPLQCRHCEEPKCVQACIAGALVKDPVSGIIANNPDRCVGCWMCVMVCPFGAIARDKADKIAVKCDRCIDQETPACVTACPVKAIVFTEIDDYSKNTRKQFLANFKFSEEGK